MIYTSAQLSNNIEDCRIEKGSEEVMNIDNNNQAEAHLEPESDKTETENEEVEIEEY